MKAKFTLLLLTLLVCQSALATKIYWTGTFDDRWNIAANWDLGRTPIATDSVYTSYGDDIRIPSGYSGNAKWTNLLGNLEIESNAQLTIHGHTFRALANVTNYGTIHCNNSVSTGMLFSTQASDVTFHNYGEIYIDNAALNGFEIKNNQVFTNHTGALLKITNSGQSSFYHDGVMENLGIIQASEGGNGISFEMDQTDAEFNNNNCGKVTFQGQIVVTAGTFNNYSFLKQNYIGTNDLTNANAIFNNYQVIEDLNSSFGNTDLDIQGVLIKEVSQFGYQYKTGEDVPLFHYANFINGSYSDVFTDVALTTNAGSYDASTNIWNPNEMANGLSSFYMQITLEFGCKDTVRINFENPILGVIYWTGPPGLQRNWNSNLNWSTFTIPTASDIVAVHNENAIVNIPITYHANVKQLHLSGKLTIQVAGSLTTHETGNSEYGIITDNAEIINNGSLNLSNSLGMQVVNTTITNNQNLNCTGTGSTCIYAYSSNSSIINNGTITSSNTTLFEGSAAFTNAGTISASNCSNRGIDASNFINEGTITVTGTNISNSVGLDVDINNMSSGIISVSNFDTGVELIGTNSGQITAQNCTTGVRIKDDFSGTDGSMLISTNNVTGINLSGGITTNLEGATISSNNNTGNGISVSSQGELDNAGDIIVEDNALIGIKSSSDLTNRDNGHISINNSGSFGLQNDATFGAFTNMGQGRITITNSSDNALNLLALSTTFNEDQAVIEILNSMQKGLSLQGGELTNQAGATININNAINGGLDITQGLYLTTPLNSDFRNYGNIIIGPNGNHPGINIAAGSSLVNEECSGNISNHFTFLNSGTFENKGTYRALTITVNNSPNPMLNTGIVDNPNGSILPSNITFQGFIIEEVTGNYEEIDVITDIISIPVPNTTNINIETNWYTDANLTTIAGTYDPSFNSLTLNANAVGLNSLFFRSLNSTCIPSKIDTFELLLENPITQSCTTATWLGGIGSWTNAAKWDIGRVPEACDMAVINGTLDSVLISTSTALHIKGLSNKGFLQINSNASLILTGGSSHGILNEGLIRNLGSITVDNHPLNGYMGLTGSVFSNEGSLLIKNVLGRGMQIQSGLILNSPSATITMENLNRPALWLASGAIFQQKGTVNIP